MKRFALGLCLSLSSLLFADDAKIEKKTTPDTKAKINKAKQKTPAPLIATYRLEDIAGETLDKLSFGDLLSETGQRKITYANFLSGIRYAKSSDKIKALVIYPEGHFLGLAQISEINKQLRLIQEEKPVYIFTRSLDNASILLSAGLNKALMPEAQVIFNGINVEQLYFKKLLDKLHLQADVVHIGDYKSAFEPFYLAGPSPEAKAQSQELYQGLFSNILSEIASSEKSTVSNVSKLADKGLFSASEAAQAFNAKLAYKDEFLSALKKRFQNAKFEDSFGISRQRKEKIEGFGDIMKLFQPPVKKSMPKNTISIAYLEGGINMYMAKELSQYIKKMAKEENVKAMILRINSPGGSALASEVIWRASKIFKDSGKKLIVSMGNVAASGGYYSAVEGELILAENNTITGSIGVIGGKIVINKMLEEISISVHRYKSSENADIYSSNSLFTKKQRQLIRHSMTQTYETFLKRVRDGRKNKLQKDLDQIAGGRVFTGRQALDLGLVDEIGGLRDAISKAKELAGLENYSLHSYPQPQSTNQVIDQLFFGSPNNDDESHIHTGNLFTNTTLIQQILPNLPISLQSSLKTWQNQMQSLSQGEVLLLSPQYLFPAK